MTRRTRRLAACATLFVLAPAFAADPPPAKPLPHGEAKPFTPGTPRTELPSSDLSYKPDPGPAAGWFAAEVLAWKVTGQNLPPLVTASPAGTPLARAGVLGASGTRVLVGGDDLDGLRGGYRLSAGVPLGSGLGLEAAFFTLGTESADRPFGSAGDPVLARPFLDATTGTPSSRLVGFPGLVAGAVGVHSDSHLWGFEGNGRRNLLGADGLTLDALVGYRFVRLTDTLTIQEVDTLAVPAGAVLAFNDDFRSYNTFHGGQVGLAGRADCGAWSVAGVAKVAVGNMHQEVRIAGRSAVAADGGSAGTPGPGGFLALGSNAGTYSRDRVAVVPEVGLTGGYQVARHLRVTAGYSALYLSNVVRAGEQIDPVINPALLPPALPGASPLRPAFTFRDTDAWVHGFNLGLEVRW